MTKSYCPLESCKNIVINLVESFHFYLIFYLFYCFFLFLLFIIIIEFISCRYMYFNLLDFYLANIFNVTATDGRLR